LVFELYDECAEHDAGDEYRCGDDDAIGHGSHSDKLYAAPTVKLNHSKIGSVPIFNTTRPALAGFFIGGLSMVEFTETAMRMMCRNPRCGCKLPKPVSNSREAFCCKGCHTQFYRKHCLVCEGPIVQPKRGERLICKKAACIKAFRESSDAYRCQGSQTAESISETPDFISSKQPLKPDRGWFIVAGPKLTPLQFHCAIVGAREAVDSFAEINANHWRAARSGERGYRLSDVAVVETAKSYPATVAVTRPDLTIPDDLSIPAFLDRRPRQEPLAQAA
jgi:hypothetical protein